MRGGNGFRLMHNDCPYYANELQQPLSYVLQNELWFALMAKFLHRVMGGTNTLISLQQTKTIDQSCECILFKIAETLCQHLVVALDNTFNG